MAVIALISAKGSPGVTTTSLAMTLAWPRPVMLVEADPSGGDILAGYLRGQLAMDRGLVQVAVAARQHRIVDDFNAQLLDIAKPKSPVSRVLLSGLADPAQAATVGPTWDLLATHFSRLGHPDSGTDVIVDCGRLATNHPPLHVLAIADSVILVVRATLRSASTAKAAVEATRYGLGEAGQNRLGLIVIDGGEYRSAEVAKALHVPVIATMPWRPSEAAALSDGIGRIAGSSALLRAAREVEPVVHQAIEARQASAPEAAHKHDSSAPPSSTSPFVPQAGAGAAAGAGAGRSGAAAPSTTAGPAGSVTSGSVTSGSVVSGSVTSGSATSGFGIHAGITR